MAAASPLIHDWFSAVAAEYAATAAIECGARRVTYAALDALSNRLANRLLANGKGAGQSVAILSADPIVVMTAILGVLKAGGIFVPLDVRYPAARLQAILTEVSPDWLLVDGETVQQARALSSRATIVSLDDAASAAATPPGLHVDPNAPCYVYFSSGSTGRPKGIVGRVKAISHFIGWERKALGVQPGIRVAQITTPSFDAFLRDMFVPLCSGGTVCVPEQREDVLDSRAFVRWLEAQRIALLHCVPSLFFTLLREPLTPANLPALRHVLLAGEVLTPGAVDRWMAVFGERIALVNLYGPSETTMIKFAHVVRQEDRQRRSIPIGTPIEGAAALLLDEQGRVCPANAVGQIYIRTPYRSLGYLNQPALTAAVFVQNPFSDAPDDLVYKTGDLGKMLPDGTYEFLGRADAQVKIRGVRIELAEIEDALRSHPAVAEAGAMARPDGEGNLRLVAYVALNGPVSCEALRDFLAQTLPEEMLPSAIVVLDTLPRTISGKLDRMALPEPDRAGPLAAGAYAAPQSETEKTLAAIWAGVLELDRVGLHDDFFKIGGHSLLAMSVISRTRQEFDIEIPLRCLFDDPTIAAFARQVDALRAGTADEELALDAEYGEL